MATKAKMAREPEPKGELIYLPPEKIKISPANRGRYFDPDVTDLVESIKTMGVLQPIGVSRDHELFFGNRRYIAVKRINDEKLTEHPMLIPCRVMDVTPEQAFLNNLTENFQRERTTAIDDAHNIHWLMTQYNKSKAEIGEIYKKDGKAMSTAWVTQRLSLLDLSEDTQRKVHEGHLKADAGMFLADFSPDVRPVLLQEGEQVAIEELKKEAGLDEEQEEGVKKPISQALKKKQARAKEALKKPVKVGTRHLKKAASKKGLTKRGGASGIRKSLRDVRELCERYTAGAMGVHAKRFFDALLQWMDTEVEDEYIDTQVQKRFKQAA